ncbi:MAG TPA: GntR family transcriptional regulator [Terracidiphilus sp.]|nr:GntR family transcriptional regulator [Terracidiphilus sp.]
MRLWLNRSGEVSLREQLSTQIILGILCDELPPGRRLPSTRELARRFGIHANTASATYRQLEQDGWVEFRHGSGVYVRRTRPATPLSPEVAVDELIGDLVAKSRKLGASQSLVAERLRRWLALAPPSRWLLIEPDPELGRIVVHEIAQRLSWPVIACPPNDCQEPESTQGSLPLVLPSKADAVRKLLPPGTELTVLQVHPVAPELQSYLQRYLPEHGDDLVGIASRWQDFQRIAQTMLVAAGLRPESLLVRDATQPGWERGLESTSAVVCDAATAGELPRECYSIAFRLIAESSLTELRTIESRHAVAAPDGLPV